MVRIIEHGGREFEIARRQSLLGDKSMASHDAMDAHPLLRRLPDDDYNIVYHDAIAARSFLSRLSDNYYNQLALRQCLAENFPCQDISRLSNDQVTEQLAGGLLTGIIEIRAHERKFWGGAGGERTAAAEAVSEPSITSKEQKKSWIEIELVDHLGKPVAGEAYEIEGPDGSVRRGSMDEKGFARITDIDPGMCKVTFPRREGREWARAEK